MSGRSLAQVAPARRNGLSQASECVRALWSAGLLFAIRIDRIMVKTIVASRHFRPGVEAFPSMLFFKVEERRLFFVGFEPSLALLTTTARTLAEITEYHNLYHAIMRQRATQETNPAHQVRALPYNVAQEYGCRE
jgi:hypothetical protein